MSDKEKINDNKKKIWRRRILKLILIAVLIWIILHIWRCSRVEDNQNCQPGLQEYVLYMLGDDEIELNVGDDFIDPGVEIHDWNGNSYPEKIDEVVTGGKVDTTKVGVYTIIYMFHGDFLERTIYVKDLDGDSTKDTVENEGGEQPSIGGPEHSNDVEDKVSNSTPKPEDNTSQTGKPVRPTAKPVNPKPTEVPRVTAPPETGSDSKPGESTPGATSAPTSKPGPTSAPTSKPGPTSAPTSTPGPTSAPTSKPGPTSAPTSTPGPTSAPTSTPGPTSAPTSTPAPTAEPMPTPAPTEEPDNDLPPEGKPDNPDGNTEEGDDDLPSNGKPDNPGGSTEEGDGDDDEPTEGEQENPGGNSEEGSNKPVDSTPSPQPTPQSTQPPTLVGVPIETTEPIIS